MTGNGRTRCARRRRRGDRGVFSVGTVASTGRCSSFGDDVGELAVATALVLGVDAAVGDGAAVAVDKAAGATIGACWVQGNDPGVCVRALGTRKRK